MSTAQKLLTEDDLFRMSDDGKRYELVRGELRQMSPAGYEHGRCTARLSHLLMNRVLSGKLGDVLAAETGFVLERTAEGRVTVRAADISFVASGRIPPGADRSRYLAIVPDLVVETLSPSDTVLEVEEKIADWLKSGVRVAVTVNPSSRSVTVYRSLAKIARLEYDEELDLTDVVSDFRCRLSEIFD
jgi:Uma2 family endonuclease